MEKKRRVLSFILAVLISVSVFGPFTDAFAIKAQAADAIDITGFETGELVSHDCENYRVLMYDEKEHWFKCTFCGKTWGNDGHTMQDLGWTRGTPDDCHEDNYHITKCQWCEYTTSNHDGRKQHEFAYYNNYDGRFSDAWMYWICNSAVTKFCENCDAAVLDHIHTDANGNQITYMNPGTCVVESDWHTYGDIGRLDEILSRKNTKSDGYRGRTWYEGVYDENTHGQEDSSYNDGKGNFTGWHDDGWYYSYCHCGELRFRCKEAEGSGTGKIHLKKIIDFGPGTESVEFRTQWHNAEMEDFKTYDYHDGDYSSLGYQYTSDSTLQLTYLGGSSYQVDQDITFKTKHQTLRMCEDTTVTVVRNGWTCRFFIGALGGITTKADYTAPKINGVQQRAIKTGRDGWVTQLELTVSGYEDWCPSVYVTVKDSDTSEVIYGPANVAVDLNNGNFSSTFYPNIEADEVTGRNYTVIVTDELGNESEKYEFNVKKVDSKAPSTPNNKYEYSTDKAWAKTKSFTLNTTDHGIGEVKTDFNGLTGWVDAQSLRPRYASNIQLTGNTSTTYGVTPVINVKDGLDNPTNVFVHIYYLDGTAPTFTTTVDDISGRDRGKSYITVNMDDLCQQAGKAWQGSGKTADGNGNYGFYVGISTQNNVNTARWSGLIQGDTYLISDVNHSNTNGLNGGTYYVWVKDYAGNISTGDNKVECHPYYNVTYDGNGETSGSVPEQEKLYNIPLTLRHNVEPGFEKTGYLFQFWNTRADNNGSRYDAGSTYTDNAHLHLFAIWNPITYYIKYNPNFSTSQTMSNSTHTYDESKQLSRNTFKREYTVRFEPVGGMVTPGSLIAKYTFLGWSLNSYATSPDNDKTDGASVVNLTTKNNDTVNLYAVWKPNSVTLSTPSRIGWTFESWFTDESGGTSVGEAGQTYTPSSDVTLYARWSRQFTLKLSSQYCEPLPEYTFTQKIFSPTTQFVYDNSRVEGGFTDKTTRTSAKYTVTFMGNDFTKVDGRVASVHLINKGSTNMSTALSGNTITAYPTFQGWHTKPQNDDRTTQMGDVKVGHSGTTITVTPNAANSENYTLAGNAGTASYTGIKDSTITLYTHWSTATIVLPDATRQEDKTDNGQTPDKFIGWFSKEQPEDGDLLDGGEYYGGPGDVAVIRGDVKLYPWFNVAPTIVHGKIKDGFYENQKVTSNQLLTLVDASDADNPEPVGPEGEITYNGARAWIALYSLNARSFLSRELGMTDAQINAVLSQVNYNSFKPEIVDIKYYCDGKDVNGASYSDFVVRNQDAASVRANGLATKKQYVGKIEITYQITDNGTYDGMTKVLIANGYSVNSPITVQYVLTSDIKFNELPTLKLTSTAVYTTDEALNNTNIGRFILDKQQPHDKEDDTDNKPWWATGTDATAFNDKTKEDLFNTLKIVDVYDITFSSGYEIEHPNKCETVSKIHSLSELWQIKEADPETFNHITSYKIEFDCMDQFGKTASGRVYDTSEIWDKDHPEIEGNPGTDSNDQEKYGQSKEDRTIVVTPFNNKDDYDLSVASVSEEMRYIDSSWTSTLDDTDYWGASGKTILFNTFMKYAEKNSLNPNKYEGYATTGSDQKVGITVNDYTNN